MPLAGSPDSGSGKTLAQACLKTNSQVHALCFIRAALSCSLVCKGRFHKSYSPSAAGSFSWLSSPAVEQLWEPYQYARLKSKSYQFSATAVSAHGPVIGRPD